MTQATVLAAIGILCLAFFGPGESASIEPARTWESSRELRFFTAEPTAPDKCAPKDAYTFTSYDYVAVIGMLFISVGIGVFYGFFQGKSEASESSNDFLIGTDMNLFTVALSLMTSFITAIELLGNPAEIYFNGMQYSLIVISLLMVVPVACYIFYPIYFKMELFSCYEYLGVRFDSNRLRVFGAVLYIIQMSFYTSVAVLAPAIALSKATGLSTTVAVIFIFVVCVFYASQGGMKAVVIADTFQALVLLVSLMLVIVVGTSYVDDLEALFEFAKAGGRLDVLNTNPNPIERHSMWSVVIGGFFYWTSLFCTNQAAVQKCLSLRKNSRANLALLLAVCGVVIIFLINFYTGILIYDKYGACDPLTTGEITALDQLLPHYVMDTFANISSFTGIFVAGIFAASLGTVAAALNSLAAVTLEDVIVAGMNVKIDSSRGALYAKWISIAYGIITFGLVFLVQNMGGILQVTLTLNGLLGGVTLGLFSLGIFFKRANSNGAFYGTLAALAAVVFLGIMAQLDTTAPFGLALSTEECLCFTAGNSTSINMSTIDEKTSQTASSIYRISYMWYPLMGCILTVLFSLAVSQVDDMIRYGNVLKITNSKELKYPQPSSLDGIINNAYNKD